MTTRSMIRIRPGAGYIAILAILAILNILVLAAGCSADRKTARGDGSIASIPQHHQAGAPKPKQHTE